MGQIIYHPRSRYIYFIFVKFRKKLFKAKKIQREFNENQNEFKVEDERQKLQEQLISSTFKQTKELGNKLDVLEKNSETTSEQSKELRNKLEEHDNKFEELEKQLVTDSKQIKEIGNKLEELERKMESNFETTKKLDDKLEEILKLLKRK